MNEEYSSYGQYPYEDEYPPVQDQYYNVPVKQKKIPSGGLLSGGIPNLLWAVEIFVCILAVFVGAVICSFQRYHEPAQNDLQAEASQFSNYTYSSQSTGTGVSDFVNEEGNVTSSFDGNIDQEAVAQSWQALTSDEG